LRHSAAAFAISTGANVYDVQRTLRHATASVTLDVYGDLFDEQHERFIESYDQAIRKARASAQTKVDELRAGALDARLDVASESTVIAARRTTPTDYADISAAAEHFGVHTGTGA
jgi:hypothetical protein